VLHCDSKLSLNKAVKYLPFASCGLHVISARVKGMVEVVPVLNYEDVLGEWSCSSTYS